MTHVIKKQKCFSISFSIVVCLSFDVFETRFSFHIITRLYYIFALDVFYFEIRLPSPKLPTLCLVLVI